MNNWVNTLEDGLQSFRDAVDENGLSRPRYGGKGLDGLAKSIMEFLLSESGYLAEITPGRKKILFLIVDSFGVSTILKHIDEIRDILEIVKYVDVFSSVAPSTTATALATLATGEPPGVHGVSGYRMYIKELGAIVESLKIKKQSEEEKSFSLLLTDTIYEKLTSKDIKSYMVVGEWHLESIFTDELIRGSEIVKYVALSDAASRTLTALKNIEKGLVVSYWSELDDLSHVYGPSSLEVGAGLRMFSKYIRSIIEEATRMNSIVVITADHGQIDVKEETYIVDKPVMDKLILPPFGERRFLYLIPDTDVYEDDLGELKDKATIFGLDEYEKLFGRTPPRNVWTRFGRYVLAALDGVIVSTKPPKEEEKKLLGHHGGLSPEELAVPVMIFY